MSEETSSGPPPGWPTALPLAPAAGEAGPGFTAPGDPEFRPSFPGVDPQATTATGAPLVSHTVVDAGAAVGVPFVPAPLPPTASPMAPSAPLQAGAGAPKSRVPVLVGVLAIATIVMGAIGFVVLRHEKASDVEEPATAIDLPKEKKKKPKPSAQPVAAPAPPKPPPEPGPTVDEPAPTASVAANPAPNPAAPSPSPPQKPPASTAQPKPAPPSAPSQPSQPARPTTPSTTSNPTPSPALSGKRKIPRLTR